MQRLSGRKANQFSVEIIINKQLRKRCFSACTVCQVLFRIMLASCNCQSRAYCDTLFQIACGLWFAANSKGLL